MPRLVGTFAMAIPSGGIRRLGRIASVPGLAFQESTWLRALRITYFVSSLSLSVSKLLGAGAIRTGYHGDAMKRLGDRADHG